LANVRSLAGDGTPVAGWIDNVPWHEGRAALMIAEGVSIYLKPEQGIAWREAITAQARGHRSSLTIGPDLASPLMVSQSHRQSSVSKTYAVFSWGVKHPADISEEVPSLKLTETYDIVR